MCRISDTRGAACTGAMAAHVMEEHIHINCCTARPNVRKVRKKTLLCKSEHNHLDKNNKTVTCFEPNPKNSRTFRSTFRRRMFSGSNYIAIVLFLLVVGVTDIGVDERGGGLLVEAYSSTYNPKDFSKNVTQLIDNLLDLKLYDKRIRPGFGGSPLNILVNMNVRSMGPFSEKNEEYAMQVYLRQIWYDTRLRFNKTDIGKSDFSMNWLFAERIWRPDTFFINGKNSYAHAISAPNLFIRLKSDGQLYMSMRLTVRASCKMHLRKFPLDTQTCPLRIASYSYTAKDVNYIWDPSKGGNPVTVDPDVELAQYKMDSITTESAVLPVRLIEEISTLTVKFRLNRLTGFFLLQVYVPCILIVCSSWVGFWITKKDAPGRVCLGVNTVLAMVILGFGGRSSFPEVAYATALDYFIILCLVFVFAAVMEFATINFLERRANKRRKKLEELKQKLLNPPPPTEGAGCIKVVPSVHTFILETFKLHLTVVPNATQTVNTTRPSKPDPKGKLIQALKLPLTAVPKADDLSEKNVNIQLTPPADDQQHTIPSRSDSGSSLAPKSYTPRLLKRLSILQGRSRDKDADSCTSSPPSSPQPSMKAGPDGPPSPATSQDLPSQLTPQISPQLSPLYSPPISPQVTSATPSPTTSASLTSSQGTQQGTTADASKQASSPEKAASDAKGAEVKRTDGTVIKVDGDEPPPPPPKKKEYVTAWSLLLRKGYLIKNMHPNVELPAEEDLLDRFSLIDLYSRRIFPSFFFILFTTYWVLFNYYITDEFPSDNKPTTSDGLIYS